MAGIRRDYNQSRKYFEILLERVKVIEANLWEALIRITAYRQTLEELLARHPVLDPKSALHKISLLFATAGEVLGEAAKECAPPDISRADIEERVRRLLATGVWLARNDFLAAIAREFNLSEEEHPKTWDKLAGNISRVLTALVKAGFAENRKQGKSKEWRIKR